MNNWDIREKTVLITGATDGIGKSAAEQLAAAGAHLVLVGRNPLKTESVVASMKADTQHDNIDFLLADLSSMAQIREMASVFRRRFDRLDVLINNAGAIYFRREETSEGLERTFALNHLSYFLLTNLLMDKLVDSAPSRVINVSSDAHRGGRIQFEDLGMADNYSAFRAYSQSKLANLLFTFELSQRLAGTGVAVQAMHPGFVASNFARNNGLLSQIIMGLIGLGARSPEKGAETIVYLATAPEVGDLPTGYFVDLKKVRAEAQAYDQEAARRLWEMSEKITGLNTGEEISGQQHPTPVPEARRSLAF